MQETKGASRVKNTLRWAVMIGFVLGLIALFVYAGLSD